jgi:hypothetical protein
MTIGIAYVAMRSWFVQFNWLAIIDLLLRLFLNDWFILNLIGLFPKSLKHSKPLVIRTVWNRLSSATRAILNRLTKNKRENWAALITFFNNFFNFRMTSANLLVYNFMSIQNFKYLIFKLFNSLIMLVL